MRENVYFETTKGLLTDFIKDKNICGIIRGLRNFNDFESEKNQQYWYEDLGLNIPIFYIISSRDKCHISSSAIRSVNKFKK